MSELPGRKMSNSTRSDRLAVVQAYTTIFASIAVPILIALFGWLIQVRQSEEGARKDYVQMALSILTDPGKKSDAELREWAVAVLNKTSPVPFTKSVREKISSGEVVLSAVSTFQMPGGVLMEPPRSLKPLDKTKENTNGDLLVNVIENYGICRENALRLEALQKLMKEYDAIYNGKKATTQDNEHRAAGE